MKNLFRASTLLFLIALFNCAFGQTLVVDKTMTVSSGSYNVVEIKSGGHLTIDGPVTLGDINPNNNGYASITVSPIGSLTLTSSVNMNGYLTINNYGTLTGKSVEMQNGDREDKKNIFNNYGKHYINGDLQISSDYSTYLNYGEVIVTNYTNFHRGHFIAGNCGYLETAGLNVNKDNVLDGAGFVRVVSNINLNANLTTSKDIKFCFKESSKNPVNYKSRYGAATLTCERDCKPDPLDLKIADVTVKKVFENEIVRSVKVTFRVTQNTNVKEVKVRYSLDAKNFRDVLIVSPEALKVGSVFSASFNINKQ